MDEAMLKSGQYPNVAIMAGTDPAEVMREHGQVIQNGEKYELADADPAEVMREHGLEGCGGWVEYCMQHGDSLGEALLHADEICRAERAESIARIAKQEVDKQADTREHSKAECSHSNVSQNLSDTREQLEADILAHYKTPEEKLKTVLDWLDRQADITERELCGRCSPYATTKDYLDTIDSLTAERDALKAKLETYGKVPDQGEREELQPVESGDTREQLEADVRWELEHYFAWTETRERLIEQACEWLDRQAAITERECMSRDTSERVGWDCAECAEGLGKELDARCDPLKERIAELSAEVEKHRQRANDAERGVLSDEWYVARDRYEDDIAELTAERDKLKAKVDELNANWRKANDGWAEANAEAERLQHANNTLRASVAGLKMTVEKLGTRNEQLL